MIIPDLPVTIQDKIQNFINQYDYLKKIEPIRDNIFEILFVDFNHLINSNVKYNTEDYKHYLTELKK